MYSVPAEFAERLHQEFDGRLRVRWSYQKGAFVLEQKVARRFADAMPALANDDDAICRRDGYLHIMTIRNGDRMPCPNCHLTLKVPIFETAMVVCEYCRPRRYDYYHVAGYFELNDRFLEHLRSLDPVKGASRRNRDKVDRHNSRIHSSHDRRHVNVIDDAVTDNFTQIAGIQSVGYTGKVHPGTEL